MYWEKPGWLPNVLTALQTTTSWSSRALSEANNYYFDVVPLHLYSRSVDLYDKVVAARQTLVAYGVTSQYGVTEKDLWINETNMPACNDLPGQPCPAQGKGSLTDQTHFLIQAIAYTFAAGTQRIILHQLRDDGIGEAYGLFRNDNTARPVYTTYQVVAEYFRGFSQATRTTSGAVDRVVLTGTPRGRVTALWKNTPGNITYSLAATAPRPPEYTPMVTPKS